MTHHEDMTEAMLEASFRLAVRKAGGQLYKLAPTVKGLPDRLVLLPMGRMFLVELKTARGKLSPMQQALHERIAEAGTRVHVLYGYDQIHAWVRDRVADFDEELDMVGARGTRRHNYPQVKPPAWTKDDEALIMRDDRPEDSVLAVQLGRTENAIRTKRNQLLRAKRDRETAQVRAAHARDSVARATARTQSSPSPATALQQA